MDTKSWELFKLRFPGFPLRRKLHFINKQFLHFIPYLKTLPYYHTERISILHEVLDDENEM